MTRVGVFGDSHIAALRLGAPSIQCEFPDVQMFFFGSAVENLRQLLVSDDKIVAPPDLQKSLSRTCDNADVGDAYDLYIVCGLGLSIYALLHLLRDYRADSHAEDRRAPLSDGCFHEAVSGCLRESLAVETVGKIRQIGDKPIALIATPIPSDNCANLTLQRLKAKGEQCSIAAAFASACLRIAAEARCHFLPQPAHTLEADLVTKAIYSQTPARLARGQFAPDFRHMNAEYGAIVLRRALLEMLPEIP